MGIKEYFKNRKQQKEDKKIYNRNDLVLFVKMKECDANGKLYSYENICRSIDEKKNYCFVAVKDNNSAKVKDVLTGKVFNIENVDDVQSNKYVCINDEKFEEVSFVLVREKKFRIVSDYYAVNIKPCEVSHGNFINDVRLFKESREEIHSLENFPYLLEFAENSQEYQTFNITSLREMTSALNSEIHSSLKDLKIVYENEIRKRNQSKQTKEEKDF